MDKTKYNFCVELYLTVVLIDPYNKTIFNMPQYSKIMLNPILYKTYGVGIVSDVIQWKQSPSLVFVAFSKSIL